MSVKINQRQYTVNNDEFSVIIHPVYNHLRILSGLGELERIVGLLREIISEFSLEQVLFLRPTHGGFVPIELSLSLNKPSVQLFIADLDETHISNISANIRAHTCENIYFIKPLQLQKTLIVDLSDGETRREQPLSYYQSNNIWINRHLQKDVHTHTFELTNSPYYIHIPTEYYASFLQIFHTCLTGEQLSWDNLLHLCIMVKNAGPQFRETLVKNMEFIDYWTILDTGSTDDTIDIINNTLISKRGELFQEPFINFRDSRNRLLELAGTRCKYTLMLDDTYVIDGDLRAFLQLVRGDQYATSFSMYVKSDDVQYTSNRVLISENKLRYIYKLHEIIDPTNNINVIIPIEQASIDDRRFTYMEERTMDRKAYDLAVLEEGLRDDPDDPRCLYYMAQTYNLLKKYDLAYEYFLKRAQHTNKGFIQEVYDSYFEAGRTANFQLGFSWSICEYLYEKAYEIDPRRPESQYFIGIHYLTNGDKVKAFTYLKNAFDIGYPIHCEFSLKPTLSFYYLPKYLAELCFTVGYNTMAEWNLGKRVTQYFLENNTGKYARFSPATSTDFYTIRLWHSIYCLLERACEISSSSSEINTRFISQKPIFCLVADGGWDEWTGRDILKKGMGGSETCIVELARHINMFQCVVFCRCREIDLFEGVYYYPLSEYASFIQNREIHSCMISRYVEYVPMTLQYGNVKNVGIDAAMESFMA